MQIPNERSGADQPVSGAGAQLIRSSILSGSEIDFSIVIPSHNRPMRLRECLGAIAQLTYPPTGYEVVVVDDGSIESLEPIVASFLGLYNLTLLHNSHSGPAVARNAGALAAKGRYVVFTDDDCRPDPRWLDTLAAKLSRHPSHAVGGRTINGLPRNLFSSASQSLVDYLYEHWNRDWDDAIFIASNNLVFPRVRFLDLKGFDDLFPMAAAEDRELCYRWRSHHDRITYAPEAVVRHFHELDLKAFLRQHFNYGRGARIFREIRCRRSKKPPARALGSFYIPLIGYAFRCERGLRGAAIGVLIWLSQVAMVLGYLRESCSWGGKFLRRHSASEAIPIDR
jgi:glycosyltransferase involved in cell wall biosynthesis